LPPPNTVTSEILATTEVQVILPLLNFHFFLFIIIQINQIVFLAKTPQLLAVTFLSFFFITFPLNPFFFFISSSSCLSGSSHPFDSPTSHHAVMVNFFFRLPIKSNLPSYNALSFFFFFKNLVFDPSFQILIVSQR
jgi:hypothetical protein